MSAWELTDGAAGWPKDRRCDRQLEERCSPWARGAFIQSEGLRDMASLTILSYSITPTIGTPCTVTYEYEVSLSKAEVQGCGSLRIQELLVAYPEATAGEVSYADGKVFVSGGSGSWHDITGPANAQLWGDDKGDRDTSSFWDTFADDDDLQKNDSDPHQVPCKAGTHRYSRTYTVSDTVLNEDSVRSDEIYLFLRVSFPGLILEAQSTNIAVGTWG